MWQQCLTFGDNPMQLISWESATDIMIAGLIGPVHPFKSREILPKVMLKAEL